MAYSPGSRYEEASVVRAEVTEAKGVRGDRCFTSHNGITVYLYVMCQTLSMPLKVTNFTSLTINSSNNESHVIKNPFKNMNNVYDTRL